MALYLPRLQHTFFPSVFVFIDDVPAHHPSGRPCRWSPCLRRDGATDDSRLGLCLRRPVRPSEQFCMRERFRELPHPGFTPELPIRRWALPPDVRWLRAMRRVF